MPQILQIQPPPKKDFPSFDDWAVRLQKQLVLGAAPTLTISSNTISPATPVSFVGAGLIKTITPTVSGTITIIPTAAFTTDATGNIAIASTATISRAMTFTYDSGTLKWYPSY